MVNGPNGMWNFPTSTMVSLNGGVFYMNGGKGFKKWFLKNVKLQDLIARAPSVISSQHPDPGLWVVIWSGTRTDGKTVTLPLPLPTHQNETLRLQFWCVLKVSTES